MSNNSLSQHFKYIMSNQRYLEYINSLIIQFNIDFDLKNISFVSIIKNIDKKEINKNGMSLYIVRDAINVLILNALSDNESSTHKILRGKLNEFKFQSFTKYGIIDISFNSLYKVILSDLVFFDNISCLLKEYSLSFDFKKISPGIVFKHVDKIELAKKANNMKTITNAFKNLIISQNIIFNKNTENEFKIKLEKINHSKQIIFSDLRGSFMALHSILVKSSEPIIQLGYLKLRDHYSTFNREFINVSEVIQFMNENNLNRKNEFYPDRYFNILKKYLQFNNGFRREGNKNNSVWAVKK